MNVSVFNVLRSAYDRLYVSQQEHANEVERLEKQLDTVRQGLVAVQKQMTEIGGALDSHRPGTTDAVHKEVEERASYFLRLEASARDARIDENNYPAGM